MNVSSKKNYISLGIIHYNWNTIDYYNQIRETKMSADLDDELKFTLKMCNLFLFRITIRFDSLSAKGEIPSSQSKSPPKPKETKLCER